ncbi:MAG TPA: hypothetical protein VMV59_04905, partial [Candidatus Dormibacteraeota bacterium]|nr:hypothetical protein [Candidatus Dormibacteraeota bacterium]
MPFVRAWLQFILPALTQEGRHKGPCREAFKGALAPEVSRFSGEPFANTLSACLQINSESNTRISGLQASEETGKDHT